jgi:hypothetical protein
MTKTTRLDESQIERRPAQRRNPPTAPFSRSRIAQLEGEMKPGRPEDRPKLY